MNCRACLVWVCVAVALSGCEAKKSPWTAPAPAHDASTTYGEPEDTSLYLAQSFRRILDLSTSDLQGPLSLRLDALYLPAAARVWLIARFGADLGATLADDLDREWPDVRAQLQRDLEDLKSQIPPTVYSERAQSPGNRTGSLVRNASLQAMVSRAPLSGVVMQRGTLDLSITFEHLVFLEGEFRYIGSFRRLEPRVEARIPLPFPVLPGALLPPTNPPWTLTQTPAGVEVRKPNQPDLYNLLPIPEGETLTFLTTTSSAVAAGTRQGRLILWNPDTGRELARIPAPKQETPEGVRSLHVLGATLLAVGDAGHLWLWDTDLGRPLVLFGQDAVAAWLSPSGVVFSVGRFGGLSAWDLTPLF